MEYSMDDPKGAPRVTEPTGYTRFDQLEAELEIRSGGDFICDISHLGFAAVSGPDAVQFLHGQLTNDLLNLRQGESQLTGYCTNKGRLLGIFRAYRDDGDVYLQANKQVLGDALGTLQRFVFRAKLSFDFCEDIRSFGVFGPKCGAALEQLTGTPPSRLDGVSTFNDITVMRHSPDQAKRFQVIGPSKSLGGLWQMLTAEYRAIGSWAWASAEVHQGRPAIFEQTKEEFLPHSLNMDLLDAVNFKKGCYPGQEIVARMQYRGKTKQRMVRAHVDLGPAPAPGDKLYAAGNEQSIGMLVDVAPAEKGFEFLTTIRLEYIDTGDIRLNAPSGAVALLAGVPYPLDNDKDNDK